MEKLKSLISIISSIIFILVLVFIFSCEGRKTISENKEVKGDTTITTTIEINSDTNSGYERKFKEESRELEIKLKALGEKAKQKGGAVGESIKESANRLDQERKGFNRDSTGNNDNTLKEDWKSFKEKATAAIDSLGKKLGADKK